MLTFPTGRQPVNLDNTIDTGAEQPLSTFSVWCIFASSLPGSSFHKHVHLVATIALNICSFGVAERICSFAAGYMLQVEFVVVEEGLSNFLLGGSFVRQ